MFHLCLRRLLGVWNLPEAPTALDWSVGKPGPLSRPQYCAGVEPAGRRLPEHGGHVLQACVSPEAPEGPLTHTRAATGACRPSSSVWAAVKGLQSFGDGDVKTLSPGLGNTRARGPHAGSLCGSSTAVWPGQARG